MKQIKIELELYKYNELNNIAKEKAFRNHFDFLIGFADEEQEIIHLTEEQQKEYVEKSININEYYFFYNGDLAECITYCGKHEKAGITELTFQNKVYEVKK